MDLLPSFNQAALDHMRTKLADHQEFKNLAPVDKLIMLELMESALTYYLEGCLIHSNSPGDGIIQ